jgi:hypothetical protein
MCSWEVGGVYWLVMTTNLHRFKSQTLPGAVCNFSLSLEGTVLCEITLFLLGGTMESLRDVYSWRTLERGGDMISLPSQETAEE